ncbi:probable E3 ubiquitin-protein ligase EDA40 isoform X2 [Macadamia integrifolia]|uniref:probable E3 ubiquitin-protein ligase EDA40 isoform X2 n=1 Tax=Macadamia integrifolia TaxID=60698 RepID=UPI001C533992|nr:probable E3 ubiquitin-protein ligase EDA40 isoform X2 [Macadamia integrifolia]
MVGASSFRKAATKIKFPCGSFSKIEQPEDDDTVVDNNENASEIVDEMESSGVSKSLCAICLEALRYSNTKVGSPGQTVFTAQCSHSFHFSCISSNVRHGSVTCPICRAYWTKLPRNLNPPQLYTSSLPCTTQSDPILRILDDSIANFRVHRRYSLRSARYDDDDPVEPDLNSPPHPRLHLSLIPIPFTPLPPPATTLTFRQLIAGPASYQQGLTQPGPQSNRAYLSVTLAHHQATDLVLVASPNGPHLRLLKQSMALVVFSLRSIDRLAIVTYSSAATRAFPLRRMSSHGKRMALQVIDRIFHMGEADPAEGLKKGIKILDDRAHKNPRSCILHLSDSPTRSYLGHEIDMEIPIPVHRFHVGFGFRTSNGFVMHEFEDFLSRLLGGVIRETQLRIGANGGVVRLGELRGREERRISLDLGDSEFICVGYSYVEGGVDECISGEIVVSVEDKRESGQPAGGRDVSIGGRTSAEGWDYHDPYMARRWARHLHGYRL